MVDVYTGHTSPSNHPSGVVEREQEERIQPEVFVESSVASAPSRNPTSSSLGANSNVLGYPSSDQSSYSNQKSSAKGHHKRSLSVGRSREIKQPVEKDKKMEERLDGESKEVRQYIHDLRKKVGNLEVENKDLKSKLEKRELKSKQQEASMVAKQLKAKEQEKVKQLTEENKVLKKKIKELEKSGTDDGKDVEIQLSELLAENEDLKTKIGRLQQLLGKQSQFSPRYLHHPSKGDLTGKTGTTEFGHSPTGGGVQDEREEDAEVLSEGGVSEGVVLRPRKHGYRQSFRQSIHEKETQLRIRREQSSLRSRVHPFDTTSTGNVPVATTGLPPSSDNTPDPTTVESVNDTTDHRLSLSVFFNELGVNIDNLSEVQEKILQLEDSIIARDEILEEASAELRDLREKDLNTSKTLTDLKSKIIDLEGHLAMKDSSIRRLKEELDWKDVEIKRLKEHDPSLSGTITSTPSTLIASSISSSLLARHSPEGDGEEEPVSMTTLVPSKSPSGVNESGHLRQMISDLSFKLSQLQHQTDTVQREKSAIQKAANQNERLLRSTIDSYLREIRFLRQMNFQLGEERAKLEEIPEMMKQIQDMRQSLVEAEQIEALQQQIHSLNVTIKEKNCLLSDLDWQLTSKDYTINLLQKDRERQGVSVGVSVGVSAPTDIPPRQGGALSVMGNGPYDSTHGNMLSPTAVLTASDEYQHVRSFPTRPQSAGGSTQKSFLLGGHRNRSNSACRPVIQRGENFAIVMPTKNKNEVDDVLNLEESIDERHSKIQLGPSIETDDERHPLQKRIPPPSHTHHKREEEINEDSSILAQQLKRFGRHRRGASHDSFLSTHSSTSSLQNILPSEFPPQAGDRMEVDKDSLFPQRPVLKSLSPSPVEHLTPTHSKSVDKMSKVSTLKRRAPVNVKSGARAPSNGRNVVVGGSDTHKPFEHPSDSMFKFLEDPNVPRGPNRHESVSSSENDYGVIVSPQNLEPQVERNQSFASHGGESSPNSQMSEVPLSGPAPLPYRLPQAAPICSSSDEEEYEGPAKPNIRYQSRSLENLFDSGSHHLIRRSFRKEFPGYFGPSFGPYHKQTPSSDSDPHQRARTLGPYLRLPQKPSKSALNPEDIENDVLSLGGSDDERLQLMIAHSMENRATIGRVRSASTGSLMIIYQSESSVEDLKTLQD